MITDRERDQPTRMIGCRREFRSAPTGKGNSADPPISARLNDIVTDQQRPRAKDKQCSRHQQCAVLKRQGQGGDTKAPATLQVAPSPTPWSET